jgi:hypothetical protein
MAEELALQTLSEGMAWSRGGTAPLLADTETSWEVLHSIGAECYEPLSGAAARCCLQCAWMSAMKFMALVHLNEGSVSPPAVGFVAVQTERALKERREVSMRMKASRRLGKPTCRG